MSDSFFIDKLVICGLGLIGGSLAKALKIRGCVGEVVAWGRRAASLQQGVELGVIDAFSLDLAEAVRGADVVFIATPTLVAETVIADLAGRVEPHTIITDGASVKGNIAQAAERVFGHIPPRFVLGHPIAGSEQSGVAAANPDLYVKHRVILTPHQGIDEDALDLVTRMWQAVGAEVSRMGVAAHDAVLAATSHLPHVLAYALVDALAGEQEKENIFRYAAGGFRDFTRIASSDPTMWHDICVANREAILGRIDMYTAQLAQLRAAIDHGDSPAIMASFSRAKAARDHFSEMLAKRKADTPPQE